MMPPSIWKELIQYPVLAALLVVIWWIFGLMKRREEAIEKLANAITENNRVLDRLSTLIGVLVREDVGK